MNVLISVFVLLSSFLFSSVFGFTVRVNKSSYAPKERITIFWTRKVTESFKMGFRMIRIPEGITQGRTYVVALQDMESEIAELDAPTLPGRFVVELFDNTGENSSAPAQAKTPEFKVVGPDGSTGEPTTQPPPPPPPPTTTSKTEPKTTANQETKTTQTTTTTPNTTPGFVGTSGSSGSSSSSSQSTHSFTSESGSSPASFPTNGTSSSSSNQPSSLSDAAAAGSTSKPQVGLIAGAAVGGAAAVLILLAIILLLRRRRRTALKLSDNFSEPLYTSPSPSVPAEYHRPVFYPQSADDSNSNSYPPSSFSDSLSGGTRHYGHGRGFPSEKSAHGGGSSYNTRTGGDASFSQSDSDRDGRAWYASRNETSQEPLTSGGSTSSPSIMSAEAPSVGPAPNLLDRLQEFGVRSANDWPIVAEALGLVPVRPPSTSATEAPPPAYDDRSRLSRF